jgi:hypothetical protein
LFKIAFSSTLSKSLRWICRRLSNGEAIHRQRKMG